MNNRSLQYDEAIDEVAKWEKKLAAARKAWKDAASASHEPGRVSDILDAMRAAHEEILHCKHKLNWAQWEQSIRERDEEGRYRHESN